MIKERLMTKSKIKFWILFEITSMVVYMMKRGSGRFPLIQFTTWLSARASDRNVRGRSETKADALYDLSHPCIMEHLDYLTDLGVVIKEAVQPEYAQKRYNFSVVKQFFFIDGYDCSDNSAAKYQKFKMMLANLGCDD